MFPSRCPVAHFLRVRRDNALRTCEGLVCQRRYICENNAAFRVSEEVRSAVNDIRPVVALETTIYTHGFPFPDNLRLSTRLDALIRHNGAIPAHCAILDGVARVGLDENEMMRLLKDTEARKVSRRDLGFLGGLGLRSSSINGGTTIAGTIILANLAGIKVFATGGLGGVHRGAEATMDISADLTEMGRTPVAVISAGCKGFLDIPRTLEYLETEGVAVATFADGRTGDVKFPAFWCRESGSKSPFTIRDEHEAAAMIRAQSLLGISSGMLFSNPVPEKYAILPAEMSYIIDEALRRADKAGITGSANTPFVLQAIKELSGGSSITANQALIEANMIRGARIAVELSRLENGLPPSPMLDGLILESAYVAKAGAQAQGMYNHLPPARPGRASSPQIGELSRDDRFENVTAVDVLVAGAVAVDISCDYTPITASKGTKGSPDVTPKLFSSNPAKITQSVGGVAYNVATAAHFAGGSVRLCSVIGNDSAAAMIRTVLETDELDVSGLIGMDGMTGQYVAVNDAERNLIYGMADMRLVEQTKPDLERQILLHVRSSQAKWVVVDSNWSARFLQEILEMARSHGMKTAVEPVSTAKSGRLIYVLQKERITSPQNALVSIVTPNQHELSVIHASAQEAGLFERQDWWQVIDAMGFPSTGSRAEMAMATSSSIVDMGIPQQSIQLLPFIPCILVKLGSEGLLLTQLLGPEDERLFSPTAAPYIISRSKSVGKEVGGIYMRLFSPVETVKAEDVVSVNGVGDTMLGILMVALAKRKDVKVEDVVGIAQRAAVMTLRSKESVSPDLKNLSLELENL